MPIQSGGDVQGVRDPTRDDVMVTSWRGVAGQHPDRTPNKKHPRSGCSQGVADLAASLIGLGMRRSAGRLLLGDGRR
jgi:hypothetical protein